MKLRSHLILLVLAAVVPLLVFTIFIVPQEIGNDYRDVERALRETVRALSAAVDREVSTAWAVLETLAASPSLDTGNLTAFHELCVRAAERRPGAWIVLFDPSGQQVINSSKPFGAPLPNPFRQSLAAAADPRYPRLPLGGAAPVRQVFETGRRVASDLFVALDSREPTIGVGIPVRRNGQVVYALEMSLDPGLFAGLLLDQGLPADEAVLILDGQAVIIARAPDHSRWMGHPPTPDQTAQVGTGPDGFGFGRSLDGQTVYRAFVRSKATGWTTVVGRSQAAIQASTRRSILLLVGGAAAALLLGIGAAVVIGKRISTPMSALATSAPMITRGDRVTVDASGVREVQALHDALVTAAEALRESAAERERRLIAEARAVALGDSAARLQAADRTKDEFLALLSHELRSPLNAIAGWASILRSKTGDVAMASRAIQTIERNTQLLTKLVNDLLDVSRIVAGRLQIEQQRIEVVPLVEDVVESLRPDAVEKEIALQSVLDPRSGVVWADPARLSQVIGNLIGNAIKFTPRGGSVAVQVYGCASEVIIAVTDTGQGIPADFLPYAFDRFRQADLSATRQHRGLGLGLAIVRHLVEFHGGTVAAESPGEGKGARFTVRLPRLTHSDQGVPG